MPYPIKQNSPSWQLKSFAILLKTFKSWVNCTSRIFYIVFILLLTANFIDAQTIRYVKVFPTGTGDGSSWANASGQIQDMIDASSPGDSVFVKAGYFRPNNAVSRFHMKSGVNIYGSFSGTESNSSQRIKSWGNVSKFNASYTGPTADLISVFINNNVDSTGKLDGFIFENCFGGDSTAGAIQNYNSSPTIQIADLHIYMVKVTEYIRMWLQLGIFIPIQNS